MRVGILGSGLMGSKLGTLFARAGHEVVFSYARDQAKLELFGALPSDAVGRVMQRYWTSFALTGDPNSRRWNDDRIEADPWEPVSDLAQPYIAFTGRGGESTLDGMRRSFCPSR